MFTYHFFGLKIEKWKLNAHFHFSIFRSKKKKENLTCIWMYHFSTFRKNEWPNIHTFYSPATSKSNCSKMAQELHCISSSTKTPCIKKSKGEISFEAFIITMYYWKAKDVWTCICCGKPWHPLSSWFMQKLDCHRYRTLWLHFAASGKEQDVTQGDVRIFRIFYVLQIIAPSGQNKSLGQPLWRANGACHRPE